MHDCEWGFLIILHATASALNLLGDDLLYSHFIVMQTVAQGKRAHWNAPNDPSGKTK